MQANGLQNFIINEMSIFKSIAGTLAGSFLAVPAMAAPYVNVENNAGFIGTDYNASVTDLHVGYNFDVNETGDIYVQGGPAIVSVNEGSTSTEYSGIVGASFALSDNFDVYAEVYAITADRTFDEALNVATEIGLTYTFGSGDSSPEPEVGVERIAPFLR